MDENSEYSYLFFMNEVISFSLGILIKFSFSLIMPACLQFIFVFIYIGPALGLPKLSFVHKLRALLG